MINFIYKIFAALAAFAFLFTFRAMAQNILPEPPANSYANNYANNYANDDALNFYCLRSSYPQIEDIAADSLGNTWLIMKDGRRVLYSGSKDPEGDDVASSMARLYPLEPERPDTPRGFAPGRVRPYEFWSAIYGNDQAAIKKTLVPVRMRGKSIWLAPQAARAFALAVPELEKLIRKNPKIAPFLKIDGGFFWRNIAGENRLSAHSFGIAIDLGADRAPYWRWSKKSPHPMQKTYPSEIVEIMEKRGFIWGGKWHEYDLMHFEYRPELICQARVKQAQKAGNKYSDLRMKIRKELWRLCLQSRPRQ